jgi:DNA-binding XRE family transcriptional regulator
MPRAGTAIVASLRHCLTPPESLDHFNGVRIREEQEINQEEAAERSGLQRKFYSGIEQDVRNVSLVYLENVAKGLNA